MCSQRPSWYDCFFRFLECCLVCSCFYFLSEEQSLQEAFKYCETHFATRKKNWFRSGNTQLLHCIQVKERNILLFSLLGILQMNWSAWKNLTLSTNLERWDCHHFELLLWWTIFWNSELFLQDCMQFHLLLNCAQDNSSGIQYNS